MWRLILKRSKHVEKRNKEKNYQASKKWAQENKTRVRELAMRSYYKHKKKQIERHRDWLRNNPQARIADNLRRRVSGVIGQHHPRQKRMEDLGCDLTELYYHLEQRFTNGMTWENYGRNGWHVDHIIPLSHFDLMDPEKRRKACHYTNLQPLWAFDNFSKGNRFRGQ